MIIKQASDLHFTYVKNTPELREAFINKCKEFGIGVCGIGGEKYLEVYSSGYDEFEICGTDDLETQSKELTLSDLTGIPTETPEEKEVLDGIESAGEVKWKDKDDLPPVGWRGLTAYTEEGCDDWCDFHDGVVMGVNGDYVWIAHHGKFQRVHHIGSIEFQDAETPQQREDRERACAIYDMCAEADIFNEESNFWAGKFYDLGYKKEKTHGTN